MGCLPRGGANLCSLAHRNRCDFCDLRLRCPSRTPEIARFPRQEKATLHNDCELRVRWKVAIDLRFRAAISEPKTSSFCGISGDLASSTRKSLAIAIVRFWCAKLCRLVPIRSSQTRAWGGTNLYMFVLVFGASRKGRCKFGRVRSSLSH